MAEARLDSRKEEAFFRALLNATVYAHVPKTAPPANRMQFVQFRRPDNDQLTLPIFSDGPKATIASAGNVGVVSMSGRRLLELTFGATLMIDPNDDGVTLYPSEVSALLEGRPLARVASECLHESGPLRVREPTPLPTRLIDYLSGHFKMDPHIHAAYLSEVERSESSGEAFFLITVIADPQLAEPIARAFGQLFENDRPESRLPVTFAFQPPDNSRSHSECPGTLIFHRPHANH